MKVNNYSRCPYCNSKLKKSKLACPKCDKNFFEKETYIKSHPWSYKLWWGLLPGSFLCSIWLITILTPGYNNMFFLYISSVLVPLVSIICCVFIKGDSFIISDKRIIFKVSEKLFKAFLWEEINKIKLTKIIYYPVKSTKIRFGYDIIFYHSKNESCLRLWCLSYGEKNMEDIISLIKEFSEYKKKELIILEDLVNIKYERVEDWGGGRWFTEKIVGNTEYN